MSKEITPEVGDVWENQEYKTYVTVHRIHNVTCLFSWLEGDIMQSDDYTIPVFTKYHKLIERNGKPYKPKRVFEAGAFYPVQSGSSPHSFYCSKYLNGVFFLTGIYDAYCEDQLLWIGPKLDIDWPEGE